MRFNDDVTFPGARDVDVIVYPRAHPSEFSRESRDSTVNKTWFHCRTTHCRCARHQWMRPVHALRSELTLRRDDAPVYHVNKDVQGLIGRLCVPIVIRAVLKLFTKDFSDGRSLFVYLEPIEIYLALVQKE